MDLSRYNELMARLTKGDKSVIAELHELQPKVLAHKAGLKGGDSKPENEVPASEAPEEPKKPRKKKEA